MLKILYPDYSFKNVGQIDLTLLKNLGISYAMLDIDNTLVAYTCPIPDENALKFLNSLSDNGINYCFVSNNNPERVKKFNESLGAPIYPDANKPLLSGINKAMRAWGAKKENTVLIGDQVFTDVLAGKRAGVTTVLVEPIKECESLFFKCKRAMEKKVLKKYEGYLKDREK